MNSGTVSASIAKQVTDVLPHHGIGLTYQEINDRIGMWAHVTIRHAVRQLLEEGIVSRKGTHQVPRFVLAEVK